MWESWFGDLRFAPPHAVTRQRERQAQPNLDRLQQKFPLVTLPNRMNRVSDDSPLLLVDVDGVISLFGFDPAAPPAGRFESVDGVVHYLSAVAGRHLRALAAEFELIWCTGWEEKANEYLPFALDLPGEFPYLSF